MSQYINPNNRQIDVLAKDRLNNQVVLTGENEQYLVPRGVFLLEHLESVTGTTVTIKDGNGVVIASGVSSFTLDQSPVRCDYGVIIVGNLAILKGFVVRNVFEA